MKGDKYFHVGLSRTLDKREYLKITGDNFSCFSLKSYVVTPHLNLLNVTVQIRGHYLCFYVELKIITNYHQILPLTQSSEERSSYRLYSFPLNPNKQSPIFTHLLTRQCS